jgi:hypothetical protein
MKYIFLLESLAGDIKHQVAEAAAIAPLVIVPGQNFDHVPPDDHRAGSIDDRTIRVALEVHADELFLAEIQYTLQRAGGGFL